MASISEIARAADVSVESVLRVLNREKVSSDIASRVVTAMDAYGYGRLPRPDSAGAKGEYSATTRGSGNRIDETGPTTRAVVGEVVVEESREHNAEADDAIGRAREQLLQAVVQVASELENPDSRSRSGVIGIRPLVDRMTVMDALVDRLSEDLAGIKRELGRARSERLEDLTLLVDLITTSWRAVDRRLGRIEQKLERMEGLPEPYGGRGAISMGEPRRGNLRP
jgi:Bacterial regulatory proteins, lacI family